MAQAKTTMEAEIRASCGDGASFRRIFSTSATELTTTRAAYFRCGPNSEHGFDDVTLIAGTRSTVETFTYNDANEQLTHAKNGVTTTMTYDDWGRLEERDDGTHTATYAYRYGSKLYSVASDFPGGGNVTYEYGGDGKRRSRVAGVEETWFNYTVGFDVISTENDADGSSGALTMTNVVIAPTAQVSATLGDLAGTTPAGGTARYYAFDHLGSTRSAWNASKVEVGNYGFDPYGGEFAHAGGALNSLAGSYTGKPWDRTAKLFHFPYRQYSPDTARWTMRDPLGMVDGPNVYGYVKGQPSRLVDPLGLTVYVCTRDTMGGLARHAYLKFSDGSRCGANGSSGSGDGDGHDQEDTNPEGEDTNCVELIGGEEKEEELKKCCNKTANRGPWLPFVNDCHNKLKRCIKNAGLDYPTTGGRF